MKGETFLMITGKSLYAYNKDTGKREEIKIEASSITFANSPTYELFRGSTDTEDGFGGGFFPKPLKTDRGTYLDNNNEEQKVPYFLSSNGKWSYAVTDVSMLLRKDEAAELFLGVNDKAKSAKTADTATTAASCTGNAKTATALENAHTFSVILNNDNTETFDGTSDVYLGATGVLPVLHGGTGTSDLLSITVGKAEKAIKDDLGQKISTTYLAKPITSSFSIATDRWINDTAETESEYVYYYDISVPGITDKFIPTVMLDRKSQAAALEAGFFAVAESFTDVIRVRCKEIPTAVISGTYYVIEGA